MSEQSSGRGEAEDRAGVPATPAEDDVPGGGPNPTVDPDEDDPDREGEDRFDAG